MHQSHRALCVQPCSVHTQIYLIGFVIWFISQLTRFLCCRCISPVVFRQMIRLGHRICGPKIPIGWKSSSSAVDEKSRYTSQNLISDSPVGTRGASALFRVPIRPPSQHSTSCVKQRISCRSFSPLSNFEIFGEQFRVECSFRD